MGKSSKQSDPKVDAAVPSSESSKVGKRKGEDQLKKQVSAKKQRRDEVAEKQKNVKEIRSDDSSSNSEQEQISAKNGTLSKREEKGNPATSSSSEFSDDDSDEDNQNTASNAQKHDSKTVEKDTSSDISNDDDNEEDNDDADDCEKPHMVKKPVKDSESSEDSEEETEEKSLKTPQKRPKTPATLKVQNATSKKICVRNLSYSVERADMENLFKECGEIVDVRLHTDSEGRFKGFGHVLFATAEAAQKALELDNTELLRRPIKVDIAWEKVEYTPKSSNLSKTFQIGGRVQFQTTSVAGFNKSVTEEKVKDVEMVDTASIEKKASETQATLNVQNATSKKICVRNLSYSVERADMENLFKECGEIVDVHLHTDSEGRFKGFGYVLFATAAAAQKALELDNTELLRRPIKVDISWDKGEYTPKGSSLSKTFQTGGRVQIQTSVVGFNKSLTEEKVKDVEMVDASSIEKKAPETSATLKVENATSKQIYVRNLSYSVKRDDMENLFKECGEIVDIRLQKDNKGRSSGFGHVLFATPEAAQKALELDNTELLRRPIKVDISWEKGEYTPKGSNLSKIFQTGGRSQFQTTSVVGFNKSLTEEKVKDVEVVDAASIEKKAPETPATLKVQNATSKKIYVRNLSYRVEPADMENLFKECGEIVDVRLRTDSEGRSRGFGHVLFATEEAAQKALEFDNTELLRRPIRVDIAWEKGEYTPNSSNLSKTFQTGGRGQFQTTSVVDFNKSLTEEKPETQATLKVQNATSKKIHVRNLSYRVEPADMENLFKECGEIVDVRLHTDSEGRSRGFGHVLFATEEAVQKALELDNTELLRRPIKVVIAWEKGEYTPNSSNLSKTFRTGGRGRFQTTSVADFNKSLTEEKVKDVEVVDTASFEKKAPETQATLKVQNASSKKICVRNLSYRVEPADMENLFKECGEIVDVRLHTDCEGRSRGFGHVLFATEEAALKALELDNTELLRCPIKVDIAWEKGEYTPNSRNLSKTFQRGGRGQFQTTSVAGFNKSLTEEKVKDVEVVDATSFEKKAPETQAALKVQNATSKKICVRNLSYGVKPADMENLFKECGEIVDVRLHTDSEGRPRGFGHVLFATEEAAQKALELDNTELLRRPIKVDIAWENGEYTPSSSNLSRTFQKGGIVQFQTIFVAGFNKSLTEEEIKASLEEHFSSCGEITRISIPKDHHSGAVKGFAHLDFKDVDSFKKALQLNKTEVGGYYLSVEKAIPLRGGHQFGRRDGGNRGIRGGWRSGGSWRH